MKRSTKKMLWALMFLAMATVMVWCVVLLKQRAKSYNESFVKVRFAPAVEEIEGSDTDFYYITGFDTLKGNSLLRVHLKKESDDAYFFGLASPLDSLEINMRVAATFCTYWQSAADKVKILMVHGRPY